MLALWAKTTGSAGYVQSLSPAAWFRYGVGITVTGAGVSQWSDQSGNARPLLQATDTNRPALQADNSILFDGVDNFLKTDTFTLDQPCTLYLLAKQATWTINDVLAAGFTTATGRIWQRTATPTIALFSGSATASNANLAVDTYGAIAAVFNGASSVLQVNMTTPTTGDAGAANLAGLTLGADGAPASYGNVQVKEFMAFAAAHDANQRAAVIAYLRSVGGV